MHKAITNRTLQSISQRRSIRMFQDTPIDDDLIRKILDAANQAPSAHNQQSWRFVVLQGAKKDALSELVVEHSSRFEKPASSILRMSSRSIKNAPLVIAVVNTGALIEHGSHLFKIDQNLGKDFFRTMEIQSSAAAVENLLIAATSLGLGSVWLGILYLIKDEVREFLGEAKGEFMAVIPVGYPSKKHHGPNKKALIYVAKYLR